MRRRLNYLLETVRTLHKFQGVPVERLQETVTAWAVQHGLQLAVQAVVDVASHVVASLGGRVGDQYRDNLLQLGELGVLPPDFARRIAPMAGLRNILVHEYLAVDLREVHRVLNHHLDDLVAFAAYVDEFLERASS